MQNGGSNGVAGGPSAVPAAGTSAPKPGSKNAIEKMYQKKSQLEHILLRPDTYIGSVERVTETMWIPVVSEVDGKTTYDMVQKEVSFVPGLYKIFDEILVNAAGKLQLHMMLFIIFIIISKPFCR